MTKVLHGLHLVEHPTNLMTMAWKKLVSSQRKRAIMSCFRMAPLNNLPCCHGGEEEEGEEGDEGGAGASLQEKEMEQRKMLIEQSRLSDRGAAEMVLLYISAGKGKWIDMVISTINLGISVLMGGNTKVQKRMLDHLKETKDVGFFTSVAGLMQQCSILDLDAFERYNKAEGLGVTEGAAQAKNLHDSEHAGFSASFSCSVKATIWVSRNICEHRLATRQLRTSSFVLLTTYSDFRNPSWTLTGITSVRTQLIGWKGELPACNQCYFTSFQHYLRIHSGCGMLLEDSFSSLLTCRTNCQR